MGMGMGMGMIMGMDVMGLEVEVGMGLPVFNSFDYQRKLLNDFDHLLHLV